MNMTLAGLPIATALATGGSRGMEGLMRGSFKGLLLPFDRSVARVYACR